VDEDRLQQTLGVVEGPTAERDSAKKWNLVRTEIKEELKTIQKANEGDEYLQRMNQK
jgi:hypothetical protein